MLPQSQEAGVLLQCKGRERGPRQWDPGQMVGSGSVLKVAQAGLADALDVR